MRSLGSCGMIGLAAVITLATAQTARPQSEMVEFDIVGCAEHGAHPGELLVRDKVHPDQLYDLSYDSLVPAYGMQIKLKGKYRADDRRERGGWKVWSHFWDYDFDQQSCGGYREGDDGPTPMRGLLREWAGTYTTQTRFGGARGRWQETRELVIRNEKVFVQGVEIKGVMVGTSLRLAWLAQAGNESTLRANFHPLLNDPYFFNPPMGEVFGFQGGWLQANSPAGWLDFRAWKVR